MVVLHKLLFVSWILASVGAFMLGNSDLFSRLGSFGIVTVLIFILTDTRAIPGPRGLAPAIGELYDGLLKVTINSGRTALRVDALEKGKVISEQDLDGLERQVRDELLANDTSFFQAIEQTNDALIGRLSYLGKIEAVVSILATLQWGFGDILVNKVSKCGEWIC